MPASTTTAPLEFALTLGGARLHRGKLQIRLPHRWRANPATRTFPVTDAGAADAIAWYFEQHRLHAAGVVATGKADSLTTLQAAALDYRDHRIACGREDGGELAANTVSWIDRSLRPWLEGEFAETPVKGLNVVKVEAALARRRRQAATSAANEASALTSVLRHAQRLGVPVPPEMLALEAVSRPDPKPLRMLEPDEAELLIAAAPEYARRHLRFLLTTALRISESFEAQDPWIEDDGWVLHVPAWAAKERREKWVVLDADERQVLAEQRLARPAGTEWLFPKAGGGRWRYQHFRKLVWDKARARAADEARELGIGDPDKLASFRPHELRSTGVTYMERAGIKDKVIGARIGHKDGGVSLMRRRYLQTSVDEQRDAIDALDGGLLAAVSGAPTGGPTESLPPARHAASARQPRVVPLPLKATS